MKFETLTKFAAGSLLLFATGCTTYYRITDQGTGRTYYTSDFDRSDSGAVTFQDANSRAIVTLQSSEIIEISRQEFEAKGRR
jgi:hypothetical protein